MDKETFTLKLHECCGDDELQPMIRFRFQGGDNPILIDVPDIPKQTAILMPVFLNDTLW